MNAINASSSGRWSVYSCPTGQEAEEEGKRRIFQGTQEEALKQYMRLREEESDGRAIVVTDGRGDIVYACS